jgi:hypothetical protein
LGGPKVYVAQKYMAELICLVSSRACLFQIGNAIQCYKTRIAAPIISIRARFDIDVAAGVVVVSSCFSGVSTLCLSVSAMCFLSEGQHFREVAVHELWKVFRWSRRSHADLECPRTLRFWFSSDVVWWDG